jgi:phage protein D
LALLTPTLAAGADREADVRKAVRHVRTTFLKGTTDMIIEMSVRFASDYAAVATVVNMRSPFTHPTEPSTGQRNTSAHLLSRSAAGDG